MYVVRPRRQTRVHFLDRRRQQPAFTLAAGLAILAEMRLKLRIWMLAPLLVALAVGAWVYVSRGQLTRQWQCHRVAAAESFEQARQEIAWFDRGSDRRERLGELVRKWGTGSPRFDFYLGRYLGQPACSDLLREAFSKELGRRPELLPRWAHYWSHSARETPDERIDSIVRHLDILLAAARPKEIPWREVLNLQAVFQLAGCPNRAQGLSPDNWHPTYRTWLEARPAELPHVPRPASPFADWQEPADR